MSVQIQITLFARLSTGQQPERRDCSVDLRYPIGEQLEMSADLILRDPKRRCELESGALQRIIDIPSLNDKN